MNKEDKQYMSFAFGKVSTSSTKKALGAELILDSVQIEHTTGKGPYILVLLDEFYSPDKLKKITLFLEKNGIKNFKAINSLNCKITKDELGTDLSKFYRANQSDWKKHLDGISSIISVGAALYAINQSTDILIDHFYDAIFNKTYFWSPDARKYIFPIDSFKEIFIPLQGTDYTGPANTYKTHFAEYQFKQATSLHLREPVIPNIQHLFFKEWSTADYSNTKDINLIRVSSTSEFRQLALTEISKKPDTMSIDLETSGLDFMKDTIGCVTLTFDGHNAFFVPWEFVDIVLLNQLFDVSKNIIGANFKFDIKFLWRNGVTKARVTSDTVQLGHVLNEQRYNGLKSHAFFYTVFGGYDRDLDRYREKTGIENFLEIPTEILFPYATMDVVVAWHVHEAEQRQLTFIDNTYPNEKDPEWPMRRYYEEIMMPAVMSFCDIEYRGVYVDKDKLAVSRVEMLEEIEKIEQDLREIWNTGPDFDFNSPKALGRLFESLGFEELERSKAGDYLTSDASLERWRQAGRPEIKKLQRMRSLKTVLKAFVSYEEGGEKGWEQYLRYHPEDNSWRMHPTYNVMRTDTGRNRCDSPNMQNIPAHGDLAEKVKRCISTPDPAQYYLCTADYASLQIRLAAIDTNLNETGRDESLYNVYLDPKMGGDMHSRTGHAVFVGDKDFDIDVIEVEDEKGNKKTYFGGEHVKTKSRGEVKARELLPSDELA